MRNGQVTKREHEKTGSVRLACCQEETSTKIGCDKDDYEENFTH